MPTYEYECPKCGRFEQFQKITEPALRRCPACRGKVRRAISGGAGLLFKGSGFYTTDYRSEGYRKAAKADSGAAAAAPAAAPAPASGGAKPAGGGSGRSSSPGAS
jgi:putative FmdB family regulatory protein